MAENGRRELTQDPFASNGSQGQTPQISGMAVRNPGQTGGNAYLQNANSALSALGDLNAAMDEVVKKEQDEWITKGQLAYMQGSTEAEIAAAGNKYYSQGWQAMSAADGANRWYAEEVSNLDNNYDRMDPTEYSKLLMERRAQYLTDLPDDPVVRATYVAAFQDVGPRLIAAQTIKHNEWNHQQLKDSTAAVIASGAYTNADATSVMPGTSPLAVSPGIVRQVPSYTDEDVEALTFTMLGEAAGEGPTGMAAVAQVAINRANASGSSIRDVVKEPNQFSTWNKGEGGNNPEKYAGSQAYMQARNLAMQVLSGHVVDMTGGAQHYINDSAMDYLPSWWNDAVAESGGTTRIGSHLFAGKTKADTAAPGGLKFAHADQANLDPEFAGTLSATAKQLGVTLKINSGTRSKAHNKAVGGANDSRHVHGDAVDIDMTGYTDEQKTALVQALYGNGAHRFITYSNDPNVLHVDAATTNGDRHFMFDRSADNIANAPDWFKNAAAAPATPVTGANDVTDDPTAAVVTSTPSGPSTQLQEYLRVSQLPKDELATILAGQMVSDFEQGNDQVWRDAGGIAMLQELGASPAEIRQAQNAYDSWKKQSLNRFSTANIKWQDDLLDQVRTGKLPEDEALALIDDRYNQNIMTDEKATTLAQKVLDTARTAEGKTVPDGARRGMENLYRAIRTGQMTAEEASTQARYLGEKFGLQPQQIETYVGQMWTTEQSEWDKARSDAASAAKQAAVTQERKDAVMRALTNPNGGLSNLTGDIDGVSSKQYGVNLLKADAAKDDPQVVQQLIEKGMDPETAQRTVDAQNAATVYSALRKQGVIDEDLQAAFTAASAGNIIGKDGRPTDSARDAFDMYMQLSTNPNVGEAYLADYFKDDAGRDLMLVAKELYAGKYDVDEALIKAHEMIANGQNKAPIEPVTMTQTAAAIDEVVHGKVGFMPTAMAFNDYDLPAWQKASAEADPNFKFRVAELAKVYNMQQGGLTPYIAAKKATIDIINNSRIVNGQWITGNAKQGTRIDQIMGLEQYPNGEPDKAISKWLTQHMQSEVADWRSKGIDATGRAQAWDKNIPSYTDRGFSLMGGGPGNAFRELPEEFAPYHVDYDPNSGMLYIKLWANREKTELADAAPLVVRASDIGEWYKATTEPKGPNVFQGFVQDFLSDMPKEGEVDFFRPGTVQATVRDMFTGK